MNLYIRIFKVLPSQLRKQHVLLFIMGALASIAEVVSVGSIIPVSTAILNPSILGEIPFIGGWAKNQNVLTLCVLFLVFVVTALGVRIGWVMWSSKVTYGTGSYLAEANFNKLLNLNYADHSTTKINEYSSLITSKANMMSKGVINSYAVIFNSAILVSAYFITVIATGSKEGLLACLAIGIVYLVISSVVRRRLSLVSNDISTLSVRNMELVSQGFLAFKDIILNKMQEDFQAEFTRSETRLNRARRVSQIVSEVPRALIETVFIIGVVIFLYFWSLNYGEADDLFQQLPELMFLLVAVQRVLPLLQRIYGSWASIRSNKSIADDVLQNLSAVKAEDKWAVGNAGTFQSRVKELDATELNAQNIEFDEVSFGYSTNLIIENFSAEFSAGQFVTIVGPSGCGKSTLVDLLLGLLKPTTGQIKINGRSINDVRCLGEWRSCVAYVAQSPFFFEGTIRQNLLFGTAEDLDESLASDIIQLTGLGSLGGSLDEVLDVNIGAYGLRLSGGQRQRLAVARELYKGAGWLIMDEPTSALDEAAELTLIRAIRNSFPATSLLCISHSGQLAQEADIICDLREK